jgi:hypothetical protein
MENKGNMITESRLAELKQQHRAIEENIVEILKYSYAEDLKIVELKRQKLKIKDEIERLRHGGAGDNK